MPELRVLLLADGLGATQYLYFVHPLQAAVAAGKLALTMQGDTPAWDDDGVRRALWQRVRPTVLVLCRYASARAHAFVALAREHGVPVLFHLDDDLLDVPLALGRAKYDLYHEPERLANLRRALDDADLVYASTEPMARRLQEHGITAPLVCGEPPCAVEPARAPEPLPALGPVIGYMGTGGHSQDLAMVMPAIVRLMRERPDLRFETFGSIKPPPQMADHPGRYGHHAGVADYAAFVERLSELGWWIGMAPLEDNAFNRCKIDTKWVEYTYAGIAVVATDIPVYTRVCADGAGLLVRTADDWYRALDSLLRDGRRRDEQLRRARLRLAERRMKIDRSQQALAILEDVSTRHAAAARRV